MNIHDVPQDKEEYKGKSELKKVLYVTQDDGSYTKINSDGWEVENLATRQAWDAVTEQLTIIEQKVKDGKISPIPYFMHRCLMELSVLARYMGKWEWQIKRHFRPSIFKKLKARTLQQYADVFGVSIETLKSFPDKLNNPQSS